MLASSSPGSEQVLEPLISQTGRHHRANPAASPGVLDALVDFVSRPVVGVRHEPPMQLIG
jgi:hypothetical protein